MNEGTTDNTSVIDQSSPNYPNAYPTLEQAWWLMGIFFLMQFPAMLPAGALTAAAKWLYLPWLNVLGQFLAYSIALSLTIWYAFRKRGTKSLALHSAPAVAYPVSALGLVAMTTLLEPLISAIPMPQAFKEIIEQLFNKDLIVTAVLAAPILEEILFRGIVLDGFLKHYSPAKAIIWSGVVFGFIHLIPTQAVNAMFIGFALGWVYYRRRSLYLCMFLHFVNNALSSLTFLTDDTMDMSENMTRAWVGNDTLYVALLAGCAGICYGCYVILNRVLPKATINQVTL